MTRIFLLCLAGLLVACVGEESSVEQNRTQTVVVNPTPDSPVPSDDTKKPAESPAVVHHPKPALPKRTTLNVVAYLGTHESEVELDHQRNNADIDGLLLSQNKACRFNPLSQCSDAVKLQPGVGFKQSDVLTKPNYLSATLKDGQETLPATLSKFNFFSEYKKQRFFSFKGNFYVITGNYGNKDVWRLRRGMTWRPLKKLKIDDDDYHINELGDYLIFTAGCSYGNNPSYSLITDDLLSWREVTGSFSPRCGSATAVFDNKLWLIGGRKKQNKDQKFYNDVWSFSYEKGWKKIAVIPDLGSYSSIKLGVFGDQMVLVAHPKYKSLKIWSSKDGRNWKSIKHDIPNQGGLESFHLVPYKERLWLFSRIEKKGSPFSGAVWEHKIWSSSNIESWTLKKQLVEFGGSAVDRFFKRGKTLWLSLENDHGLWFSENGNNWQAYALTARPRRFFSSVGANVRDGKVQLIYNDRAVAEYGNWPNRGHTILEGTDGPILNNKSIVRFKDKLWFVEFDYSSNENTIYSSDDDGDWIVENNKPAFSNKSSFALASFNNKLWLIGENNAKNYSNDIWSSVDGVAWSLVKSDVIPASARSVEATEFKNKLWVTARVSDQNAHLEKRVVYSSQDGLEWTLEAKFSVPFHIESHITFVLNNQFWILSVANSISSHKAILIHRSDDGKNWIKVDHNLKAPSSIRPITFFYNGYLWLTGGGHYMASNADRTEYIWRTKDGAHWQKVVNTQLVLPDP